MTRRKKVLIVVAAAGLAVGGVAVFLPQIVAGFVPGIVESKAGEAIAGSVKVGSASLSWTGPQRLGNVQLFDPEKSEVVRADVAATTSLVSLIRGSFDIGEVTLAGKALVVRAENGVTNLDRAIAPKNPVTKTTTTTGSSGAKTSAGQVPAGLHATIKIAKFDVTFADQAALKAGAEYSMVSLPNLSGEAQVGTGEPTTVSLSSDVVAGATGSGSQPAALKGTLSLKGSIDDLIAADGSLHPEKASADVKLRATALPVAIVDLVAGQGGKLSKALGSNMDCAADVIGDYATGSAKFTVATTNRVVASGTFTVKDGVLTSDTPIAAAIPGTALVELVPGLRESVRTGGLELTSFPDATLRIESIVLKLPKGGFDLRGSGMVAQLQTAPIEGLLKIEGQSPRRVNITGLDAKLASIDFGTDARAVIKCNAMVDGASAGSIDTDITLGGLLDAKGVFKKGMPGRIDGRATIRGASSAIMEPFVQGMKIVPREDIGPVLNAEIVARTPRDTSTTGYEVEVKVGSDRLSADGAFLVSEASIRSITRPFSARVLSAGAIAHRFVPKESWHLNPTGAIDLVARDIEIPMSKDAAGATSMNWGAASGGIAARLFGFEVVPPSGSNQAAVLGVKAFDVGLAFAPKATPRFTMAGDLASGKDVFGVEGDLALEGLIQSTRIDVSKLMPAGRIALKNVPTSLAAMFAPAAAAGERPMDFAGIARDLAGPTVTVVTNLAAAKGKQATDVSMALSAEHSAMSVEMQLAGPATQPTEVDIKTCTGEVNLKPTALDSLLRTFMPDLRERPQLVDASQIKFTVDPVSIPLASGQALDYSRLGSINAKLQIPGRLLVRGLSRTDDTGNILPVAPAGVENLELTLKAPATVAVASGKVDIAFKARLLSQDAPDGTLASIQGTSQVDLTAPGAAGSKENSRVSAAIADLKITNVAAAALDTLSGRPGMMSGLLGASVAADVKAIMTGGGTPKQSLTVELSPKAPRLTVSKPIKLSILPDRIALSDDTRIDLQLDPAFANGYVFKADDKGNKPVRLAKPTPVSVNISKLTLSRDGSGKGEAGPLKTGIFEFVSAATIATAPLGLSDGQFLTLGNTSISLNAPRSGGPIAFNLQVDSSELRRAETAPPQAVQKISLAGTVDGYADAAGKPAFDNALVNMTGVLPSIPTTLLDSLAQQSGLLVDALGPLVSAQLKADKVQLGKGSKDPGSLEVQMDSPRATLRLKGTVQNGAFTTTVPAEVTIIEVTPELSGRISKNIPFIGAITKSKDLKPGLIRATNLVAPMDGDLSKLSADVTVDLGEALVAPGGIVNDLLSIKIPAITGALDKTGLSEAKKVGERLKPVSIAIRKGVMKYDEFKLPLGEFEIENSAHIDLGKREVDGVVWIPLGRLAAEAVPGLNKGVNSIPVLGDLMKGSFDELTMIPFLVSGSMDGKLSREFSTKLFADRVGNTVIKGGGINDAIKGLGDLLKKKDKEPEPPKK